MGMKEQEMEDTIIAMYLRGDVHEHFLEIFFGQEKIDELKHVKQTINRMVKLGMVECRMK